jgi:7-cyano-7-deazaguanine synthase in queuosine biosynthesis
MKPFHTLVFLSGGLDSTAALVKLLRETTLPLHVHFIHYMNRENRFEAERLAVEKIIPWCRQHLRDFESSRSTQDYREICLPGDVHVVRFTAAQIALKHHVSQIATGRCRDDSNAGHSMRSREADAIFNACTMHMKHRPTWVYPVGEMDKAEEIAYLKAHAPELLDMVHYCRRPLQQDSRWVDCGVCKTCLQMKNAREVNAG